MSLFVYLISNPNFCCGDPDCWVVVAEDEKHARVLVARHEHPDTEPTLADAERWRDELVSTNNTRRTIVEQHLYPGTYTEQYARKALQLFDEGVLYQVNPGGKELRTLDDLLDHRKLQWAQGREEAEQLASPQRTNDTSVRHTASPQVMEAVRGMLLARFLYGAPHGCNSECGEWWGVLRGLAGDQVATLAVDDPRGAWLACGGRDDDAPPPEAAPPITIDGVLGGPDALRVLFERRLGVPVAYEIGDGVVEHVFHAVVPGVAGEEEPVYLRLDRWLEGTRPCPDAPWVSYGPGPTFRSADAGTLLAELGRRGVPLRGMTASSEESAEVGPHSWVEVVRAERTTDGASPPISSTGGAAPLAESRPKRTTEDEDV